MLAARSIRETVENGISNVTELQGSLLTAIQLEFSTIPPYLCAQWSISGNDNGTPSVSNMIESVVVQEMLHFGFACNMFTATGGSLQGQIAKPGLVIDYGKDGLPGGVHPGLVVSLLPLGSQALQTFMSIEYPEVTPVVQEPTTPTPPTPPLPPTIGQFYTTIASGFQTVFPGGTLPSSNQVSAKVSSPLTTDHLTPINTVTDALNAINEITDQGEGTDVTPDEGTFDPSNLAHYYLFAQIYFGKMVAQAGNGYQYSGAAVPMPTAYPFSPQPDNSLQPQFITDFSNLLTQLEQCWTSGAPIGGAIGTMFSVQGDGVNLIKAGATPEFVFQPSS